MVGGKSGCFLKIRLINETAGKTAGIFNQILKFAIFVILGGKLKEKNEYGQNR